MIDARTRVTVVLVVALLAAGCASVPSLDRAVRIAPPPPPIHFGTDTFAFPNESRTKNRDKPDLYANYCFVMARAVIQFHRFARFEPAEPRLSADGYLERVRAVTAFSPWHEPLAPESRVVIPGY